MNDQHDFERLVADTVRSIGPVPPSDGALELMSSRVRQSRQDPEWLALIKEPPMRTNSHLAVGSPTVRVATILVTTLLLALALAAAGAGVQRLIAADDAIIVDASGTGDYTTIQAAVDAADDGDEIAIRPGTYAEEVRVVEKDLTLRGDGPAEDVVIELGSEGTLITLLRSDAMVTDLTLRGDEWTQGMLVFMGAPTIQRLHFDGTGKPFGADGGGVGSSLDINQGAASVLENRFSGGGEVRIAGGADVAFERNELSGGPHLFLADPGPESVVRGNTIRDTLDRAIGLFAPTTMPIIGNTIVGAGGDGITLGFDSALGVDPLIEDNDITGNRIGVQVFPGSGALLKANRFSQNETAVLVQSDGARLEDNDIRDGNVGLALSGAAPSLLGNTICGNARDLSLLGGTELPAFDESNEICGSGS